MATSKRVRCLECGGFAANGTGGWMSLVSCETEVAGSGHLTMINLPNWRARGRHLFFVSLGAFISLRACPWAVEVGDPHPLARWRPA